MSAGEPSETAQPPCEGSQEELAKAYACLGWAMGVSRTENPFSLDISPIPGEKRTSVQLSVLERIIRRTPTAMMDPVTTSAPWLFTHMLKLDTAMGAPPDVTDPEDSVLYGENAAKVFIEYCLFGADDLAGYIHAVSSESERKKEKYSARVLELGVFTEARCMLVFDSGFNVHLTMGSRVHGTRTAHLTSKENVKAFVDKLMELAESVEPERYVSTSIEEFEQIHKCIRSIHQRYSQLSDKFRKEFTEEGEGPEGSGEEEEDSSSGISSPFLDSGSTDDIPPGMQRPSQYAPSMLGTKTKEELRTVLKKHRINLKEYSLSTRPGSLPRLLKPVVVHTPIQQVMETCRMMRLTIEDSYEEVESMIDESALQRIIKNATWAHARTLHPTRMLDTAFIIAFASLTCQFERVARAGVINPKALATASGITFDLYFTSNAV